MPRVLLPLVALALLLWLWGPWEDAAEHGLPPSAPQPSARETPAELRGTGAARPGDAHTRTTAGDDPEGPVLDTPHDPGRRVVIEFEGWQADVAGDRPLWLRLTNATGLLGLDLYEPVHGPRAAFALSRRWLKRVQSLPLQAEILHPAYVPARVELGVPEATVGDLTASVRLQRAYTIQVRLAPQASMGMSQWLPGSVTLFPLDAADNPVEGEKRPDGLRALDAARQPELGSEYLLRVPRPGRYVVFATWPGFLPAHAIVELDDDDWTTTLPPIELQRARSLHGTVRLGGVPTAGVRLEVLPGAEGMRLQTAGGEVVWHDGTTTPGTEHAQTDADGRFQFETLPHAPLVVEIMDAGGVRGGSEHGPRVVPTVYEERGFPLDRSTEQLDIDLPAARLDVEVVGPEGRSVVALVHATARDPATLASASDPADVHRGHPHAEGISPDVPLEFVVPAGAPVVVSVEAEGFLPALRAIEPMPRGARRSVRIPLEVDPSLGRLTLRATAADGGRIEELSFTLRHAPQERADVPVREFGWIEGDIYETSAEPGQWQVRIAGAGGGASRYLLPAETTVDVAAGQTTSGSIVLHRGGLLRLHARTAEGSLLPASVRLLHASGREHHPQWMITPRAHAPGLHAALSTRGASTTTEALPPGRYTVELSHKGYADARASVEIEAGKTTTLGVTMRPAR